MYKNWNYISTEKNCFPFINKYKSIMVPHLFPNIDYENFWFLIPKNKIFPYPTIWCQIRLFSFFHPSYLENSKILRKSVDIPMTACNETNQMEKILTKNLISPFPTKWCKIWLFGHFTNYLFLKTVRERELFWHLLEALNEMNQMKKKNPIKIWWRIKVSHHLQNHILSPSTLFIHRKNVNSTKNCLR